MSFAADQRVTITVRTIQAGEVTVTDEYPGTVLSQKGQWVTVDLDAPLASSNGKFQSTRYIAKDSDVTADV